MKNGIILTGGTGSRLFPFTKLINKHLLNVNNKFIIDYPLQTLKNMGVENLTVVLGGNHFEQIVGYLKDGQEFSLNINYCYQSSPQGIAQAINLCQRYVSDDDQFAVILGDNIFENPITWSTGQAQIVLDADKENHPDLKRFGVASIDDDKKIVRIEEKPKELDLNFHNYAISGCYLFTPKFFDYFQDLKPSARGEYEITDIIRRYQEEDNLSYSYVNGLWSDVGTHESIGYVNHYFYQKEHGITQI